jgi:hypothetical protein
MTMAPAPAPAAMFWGRPKMPLPTIEPITNATIRPGSSLPLVAATAATAAGRALGGRMGAMSTDEFMVQDPLP